MSGVEAISMACNVMTVISFSLETIKLYRSIHEAGSSDPELAKNVEHIRKTSANVERLLHKQQQLDPKQRVVTSDAEERLADIAAKCLQYSKAIEQEIASTSPKKPGILRALRSTVKTIRRKPHLDQLKGQLQASQSTMDTAVNVQVLEQCIASGNLGREIYNKLDSEERGFIANYEQRSQAIEDLIKQLHGHITEEHITTRGHATEEHIATRETFTKTIGVMDTNNRQEQAREKLLKSLNYPQMNERKNTIPAKHYGTFEWVFAGLNSDTSSTSESDSPTDIESGTTSCANGPKDWWRYDEAAKAKWNQANANLLGWLQGKGLGPFWVSGKPGSGKSTLVKFIMHDERTIDALRYWHPQPKIIAHFLWKPGALLQHNFKGLLCSVLHQVLSIDADICGYLLHKTPGLGQKNEETDWDIEELKKHLFETFRFSDHSFLILLDGLDELTKPHRGMDELFAFLDNLTDQRQVKLCISSRPEAAFQNRFSSYNLLRMQDVNYEDILDYTLDFLDNLGLRPNDPMKRSITSEIMGKVDGVFIWAHLALQNVKNGVQEFDEEWGDIYHRILELPAGLTKLYTEMWSRTGQKRDKYVKTAALYFQIMRLDLRDINTIACLAVASDDTILESFIGRDELPSPMRLVKACHHVHKTFFSICAGLLEADTSFSGLFPEQNGLSLPQQDDIDSLHYALEKWDSKASTVRFTHRTAIDFLDSEEGVELFGKHTTSHENLISRAVNAVIILGCMPYTKEAYRQGIPRILGALSSVWDLSQFSRQVHDLFCRSYRHSHMIDDFSTPPPSFTSHGFFIFAASYHGLYEYVARVLQADKDNFFTITAAAVAGASEKLHPCLNMEHDSQRYRLITMCLENYSRPEEVMLKQPDVDDFSQLLIAWRCYLLGELTRDLNKPFGDEGIRSTNDMSIIESFISVGVLNRQLSSIYLIEAEFDRTVVLLTQSGTSRTATETSREDTAMVLEVNDYLILQVLCSRTPTTHHFIPLAAEHAFLRPVLVQDAGAEGEAKDTFICTLKNDVDEDRFRYLALGGSANPLAGDDFENEYLEFVHVGAHRDFFEALEDIGYSLPSANQQYACWHMDDRFF